MELMPTKLAYRWMAIYFMGANNGSATEPPGWLPRLQEHYGEIIDIIHRDLGSWDTRFASCESNLCE